MVTDSRFTVSSGDQWDAGKKLWTVGPNTICCFAGDVELCELSLAATGLAVKQHGWGDSASIATAAGTYLRFFSRRIRKRRALMPPTVILGSMLGGKARLYVLKSDQDFTSHPWSGVLAIGTGASVFREVLDQEIGPWTETMSQQFHLREKTGKHIVKKNGPVWYPPFEKNYSQPVRLIDVAGLLMNSADLAIERADHTVGGLMQGGMLTTNGYSSLGAKTKPPDSDEWIAMVEGTPTTFAEYLGKRSVSVPGMKYDFSIEASP